jgi:hypothetical protein
VIAPYVKGGTTPNISIRMGKNLPQWCFRSLPNATSAAIAWTNNEENKANKKVCSQISKKMIKIDEVNSRQSGVNDRIQFLSDTEAKQCVNKKTNDYSMKVLKAECVQNCLLMLPDERKPNRDYRLIKINFDLLGAPIPLKVDNVASGGKTNTSSADFMSYQP